MELPTFITDLPLWLQAVAAAAIGVLSWWRGRENGRKSLTQQEAELIAEQMKDANG